MNKLIRLFILLCLPSATVWAQTTLTGTIAPYANATAYAVNLTTGNQTVVVQLDASGVLSLKVDSAPHTLYVIPASGSGLTGFSVALPSYTGGGSTSITSLLTANAPPAPLVPVTTVSLPALLAAAAKIGSVVYTGPTVKPTGACTTGLWAITQDGFISYCKAGTWEVAVTAP